MAALRTELTRAERQMVESFAAGRSIYAVAMEAQVVVVTVERVLRRALGGPALGTARNRAARTETRGVAHG